MGACRKLHNEELHYLYSSPSKIRMNMDRACSTKGEKRNAYRLLVGKIPLGIQMVQMGG
jgi:hypothetical protein